MTVKWQHPYTAILAGPTSCGKSTFIKKFLHHIKEMCDTVFHEIIYCLPDDHPIDAYFEKFTVIRGIPEVSLFSDLRSRLVVIDDLMRETNSDVVDLFTKGSHHFNVVFQSRKRPTHNFITTNLISESMQLRNYFPKQVFLLHILSSNSNLFLH